MPNDQELKSRELDLREKEIDEKYSLESSFPRKWGAVLFGALASVAVAVVSGGVALVTTIVQVNQTERTRLALETEKQIENSRLALEIYFANIEELESKDENAVEHFALIAEISAKEEVRNIFLKMRQQVMSARQSAAPNATLTELVGGLASAPISSYGDPGQYTVYVHFPGGCDTSGSQVAEKLAQIGFTVPAIQDVENLSPDNSEVRFYKTLQRVKLSELKDDLSNEMGFSFSEKVLNSSEFPGLPDDIFEVWIGKTDCK